MQYAGKYIYSINLEISTFTKRHFSVFARVEKFIDYLENEEQFEIKAYRLDKLDSVFASPFLPNIRINYFKQKSYISRRIKENREKYAEDTLFDDVIKDDDLSPLFTEEDGKEDTVEL